MYERAVSSGFSKFYNAAEFISLSLALLPYIAMRSYYRADVRYLALLFLSDMSIGGRELSTLPPSFKAAATSCL